jgi:uncharacterized MAPEG superfamily protein
LIVAVLPYVLAGAGAYFRVKQLGTPDFEHPRVQALELRGIAARAYGAQQNAWEALPFFGTAVVIAHLAGADAGSSATASMVFVGARVLHGVMYIAGQAPLRTGVFVVGLGCVVRLFWLAIAA